MRLRARRLVGASFLSSVAVLVVVACTGEEAAIVAPGTEESLDAAPDARFDDGRGPDHDEDAGSAADAADARAIDAGDASDGALGCAKTPANCLSTARTCSGECHVTYNVCKNNCPADANLMSCLTTCKSTLMSCQLPCKGDCVTCANVKNSCTGNPDCEAEMFRPSGF